MNVVRLRIVIITLAVLAAWAYPVFAEPATDAIEHAAQLAGQGDLRGAEKEYRHILAQDASQSRAYLGLAGVLYGQGKFAQSQAILEGLVAKEPKLQAAWYMLGLIYERQGRMDQARDAFHTYVAIAPQNVSPDPAVRVKLRQHGIF